ncbi:MAG: hypothetical protein R2750_03470 [Bacteroidales bacterium]
MSFSFICDHSIPCPANYPYDRNWNSLGSITCHAPYAMLANSIPPKQMGMFMGLFNMSITIPQIVNGVFRGLILQYFLMIIQ